MAHAMKMVAWARDMIEQPVANTGYFHELDVLDYVNESYRHHCGIAMEARGDSYFGVAFDLPTVAGESAVRLPVNFIRLLPKGAGLLWRGTYREDLTSEDYIMRGDHLVLGATLSSTAVDGLRIYGVQDPPDLLAGKFPFDVVASNTVQLPSVESEDDGQAVAEPDDDVYIESTFTVLSGTSAGQMRRIIDYNGSSKAALVDSAIDLAEGDSFAFIPRLPGKFHRMIARYAAILMRQSRDESFENLESAYVKEAAYFQSIIEDRAGEPASVRPWDPVYGMFG